MQVDEILASKGREVRTIQPDATIGEAIGRLCAERVGALVVSEDGRRIAGIISDRGITWAIAERGARPVPNSRVISRHFGSAEGGNAGAHVEFLTAIRVHVLPEQRRE